MKVREGWDAFKELRRRVLLPPFQSERSDPGSRERGYTKKEEGVNDHTPVQIKSSILHNLLRSE